MISYNPCKYWVLIGRFETCRYHFKVSLLWGFFSFIVCWIEQPEEPVGTVTGSPEAYCGTAPFPNRSGTSKRGKTKVSHLANKKAKILLDLCAKSALQHNPEMKMYYKRRLESGKTEMETINVIRNKLLSRVFAVVKRGTQYVDIAQYAA